MTPCAAQQAAAGGPPCWVAGRANGLPLRGGLDTVRLADGRLVRVRHLQAEDGSAEQAFVVGLSRQSRYRRFHVGIPELPPSLLARMLDVDGHHHVALVAVSPDDPQHIVADARYVRAGRVDGQESAEFAVVVADEWQGVGLGRLLLGRLAGHARQQGVDHLHGDVLWDNRPMVGLVDQLGGTLQAMNDEPGVLRATFRAGRPRVG
jgi:acetyltransferase